MSTMRVTMTRTTMGESGSLLTAGSTYTVSTAFGAYLVGQAKAATDPDGALSPLGSEPLRLATNPVTGAESAVDQAGKDTGLSMFFPGLNSVLSKYGKTAYDITLSNVTPASATNMTWSRTAERSRFGNETVKIQPSADTGCFMHFASMGMVCDPVDLLYSIDVYIETMPPTNSIGNFPYMTVTLSNSAGLGANYDQWIFDQSSLRQGWNTLKFWAGDDTSGGYRDSNMAMGTSRAKTGTGFDFTQAANYFGVRFSYMNGYTVHLDQIRRGAKARTKIVFGMDGTGSGSGDNTFTNSFAPLLARYNVPCYLAQTWVYDYLYTDTASWDRTVALVGTHKWDAINHTWNHGGTIEGRRNVVTLGVVSDLTTVTFSNGHGITIGRRFKARISGASTSACNGIFWLTATTTTQATYTATGAGTVTPTGTINLDTTLDGLWPATGTAEDQRLLNHEIADMSALMRSAGMGQSAHLLAWPNNSVADLTMTQIACAAGGVAFARGGRNGNVNINEFGIDNPLHFGAWPFESSASLYTTQTTLKNKILGAIGRGDSVFIFGHFILDETDPANIAHVNANLENPPGRGGNPAPPAVGLVNADGGWWYLGQVRQFLDWLQTYRNTGAVEVISFPAFAKLNSYGVGK